MTREQIIAEAEARVVCGSCGPHRLTQEEVAELFAAAEAQKAKRAADMPTEQDAIHALTQAVYRLNELGWRDPIYCPKDGSEFDVIEAGSSGIHVASYWGDWPNGGWHVHADGDCWPSRPILYRATEAEKQRLADAKKRFAAITRHAHREQADG